MARKVGALSTEEQLFILDNIDKLGIKRTAEAINRNPAPVIKYLDNKGIPYGDSTEEKERNAIRGALRNGKHWPKIKEEFTEAEVKYFEHLWVEIFMQFDNDVNATEELQIKKYITLKILHSRVLIRLTSAEREVERLRKELDAEYAKPAGKKNGNLISQYNTKINETHGASNIYNRELMDIIKNEEVIEKSLKISRDQRIQSISDATKNWSNILRLLQDNSIRQNVGEHIEIMRRAKSKEMSRLSDIHKFSDGTFDTPVLTAETIDNIENANTIN